MFQNRKKTKIAIICLLALVGIWVLGDFIYSRVVASAVRKWEKTIQRDEDGVQVGTRSWALPGKETALLLVHGFNDTPRTFNRMGPLLNEHGHTVRAVRLPGFGVHVREMNDCTGKQWVDKVVAEARELRTTHSRVIVVGHSLGGAVTISSILANPELFDGAVLLAPAVDVADERSPLLPVRFWQALGDRLLMFSTVYQTPYNRNDCRDPEFQNPPEKPPFSTRNIVQQTFRLMDQNKNQAPNIKMPLLMILSRDDQVVDWKASQGWFEQLGSNIKQIEHYDKSGHALTVDYDWKNVTQNIIDFTKTVSTGDLNANDSTAEAKENDQRP